MELTAQTKVPFPLDTVFKTYRDNLPEIVPFMPNIASIEIKERRENGSQISLVNFWTAKTEIPALVKKLIRIDSFAWTDYADWDTGGLVCRWRTETQAIPGFLECNGTTSFAESGNETIIRVDGNLILHLEKAHVPRLMAGVVQPMIEKIIVTGLKPNLLSAGEGVGKLLGSRKAAS